MYLYHFLTPQLEFATARSYSLAKKPYVLRRGGPFALSLFSHILHQVR